RLRPHGFAVMTGDDASLYTMLAHGGDGGILASAHLRTERFVEVHERMRANDHRAARAVWAGLECLIPILFKEANPMPIKHALWREGLIGSPECRLPLTRISPELANDLERALRGDESAPADVPYAARSN
ncbi:MAG TPA: dihydrodipicolinate synthase family protein, partial [Methylomirabilota bacterium]